MHLTPRELEKLIIHQMSDIALRRKAKGLKLNHPESMAVICAAALEGAREGKTVEEVMKDAAAVLTRDDVMEGVPEMIPFVQLEAVFTDGSRLAFGKRLDIPATTAIRFEPGDEKEVTLVPMGGKQFCLGFANLVDGWTGDGPTPDFRPNYEAAVRRAKEQGFKSTES
ncbi:hypothetical protein HK102_013172 [Quaeritorhiza haematococci]|nr:hypothetical protein HK102_013172 [Quaeritorhiza haematococci]